MENNEHITRWDKGDINPQEQWEIENAGSRRVMVDIGHDRVTEMRLNQIFPGKRILARFIRVRKAYPKDVNLSRYGNRKT